MTTLQAEFFVVKIKDKFQIFSREVKFPPIEFHTVEDAHLWLLRYAQSQSTEKVLISCVEVIKNYIFVASEIKRISE